MRIYNKFLLAVAIVASSIGGVLAQSAIIRGEESAGVYANLKSTSGVQQVIVNSITVGVPTTGANLTWLASAARTTTQTLADVTNSAYNGIHMLCNVTAAPGVQTLTLTINMKDVLGNVYIPVAASSATTATGVIAITVYPGITPVAASVNGQKVADRMSRTWNAVMTHSGAGSWTYSCGYITLL